MSYWGPDFELLKWRDPEVAAAILGELERERTKLQMIASENFASPAVLAALGSVFTNKYAEGLPGKRYYGGCEFADQVEELARERAKRLFGAEHANVQPHAGAQANMAAYAAFLDPGDTILGMDLAHGGHLTHGSPVNFSGRWFRVVHYGVTRETETIDYDQVMELAKRERPKMIVAGATAYPRVIDFAPFREAADASGAVFLVDAAHIAGLIVGGAHPNPFPMADVVTTTTHKTLRGPRGAIILCRAEHARAIDRAVFPMIQGGPLVHSIAAKAVCFKEALDPSFKEYAHQIVANSRALARVLLEEGLRLVSGGTDNHLLLVDLTPLGLTGKEAETLLGEAGIVVNKNAIPFDPLPPAVASGIRVGTAALTTQGMRESEMEIVGNLISRVLKKRDEGTREQVRREVAELAMRFPPYPAP